MRALSLVAITLLVVCACTRNASSSGSPASASSTAPAASSSVDASSDVIDAAPRDAAGSASADASTDASTARFTGKDWPSLVLLTEAGNSVRDALVARDMHRFAGLVHPTRGVRFSPYAYVDAKADVVLRANDIEAAFASQKARTWGSFDGSGEPIVMTFRAYVARFVAFSELAHLSPRLDATVASGNTTNNQREVYGGAPYVEYYSPGKNGGSDWEALRVVFEAENGKLFVVGIIHDVWTI